MSRSQFKVLRVEEPPAAASAATGTVVTEAVQAAPAPKAAATGDVDHWRRLAIQTGERLAIAEEQARALREAADDARARFGKYKDRLDKASGRVNELTIEVVRLNAERETWKARIAERDAQLLAQAEIAREIYACREAAREWFEKGPLWDLFVKFAVSPPTAGEEQ